VLISSPLSPSQKSVRLIPAENKRTQLCLQTELAEEKPQSLHSQKIPRWAQQMYITKEKNRYSEIYKKVLFPGPKSARNVLINLSPNPARPEKPGPTYNSGSRITKPNQIIRRNWFSRNKKTNLICKKLAKIIRQTEEVYTFILTISVCRKLNVIFENIVLGEGTYVYYSKIKLFLQNTNASMSVKVNTSSVFTCRDRTVSLP